MTLVPHHTYFGANTLLWAKTECSDSFELKTVKELSREDRPFTAISGISGKSVEGVKVFPIHETSVVCEMVKIVPKGISSNFQLTFVMPRDSKWLTDEFKRSRATPRMTLLPTPICATVSDADGFVHGFAHNLEIPKDCHPPICKILLSQGEFEKYGDMLKSATTFLFHRTKEREHILEFEGLAIYEWGNLPETSTSFSYQRGFLKGLISSYGDVSVHKKGVYRFNMPKDVITWIMERASLLGFRVADFHVSGVIVLCDLEECDPIDYEIGAVTSHARSDELFIIDEPSEQSVVLECGVCVSTKTF